jgi:hypothetical protein
MDHVRSSTLRSPQPLTSFDRARLPWFRTRSENGQKTQLEQAGDPDQRFLACGTGCALNLLKIPRAATGAFRRKEVVMFRAFLSGVVAAALATAGVATSLSAAEISAPPRSYRLTIDSTLTMSIGEAKQLVEADTTIGYTRQRVGQKVTVWFDEVAVRTVNNGQEAMNVRMNAKKVVVVEKGVSREVLAENAPEDVRQQLRDCFGGPMCEMAIDAEGVEGKAKILAGPGAKTVIDNGLIAGTRLFHVVYPSDADQWDANMEVSMGSGGYARGVLHYEKVGRPAGGRTLVRVSGTLSNDHFQPSGSPVSMRKALYIVTGEQIYDHTQQEWASGSLVMQVNFELLQGETLSGNAAGTMSLQLKQVTR